MQSINDTSIATPEQKADTPVSHTPGPWHSKESSHRQEWSHWIFCDSYQVAATSEFNGACEEADANARLIAAAPELLAALQSVLKVPEALKALTNWGTNELIAARTAISKAEGRS